MKTLQMNEKSPKNEGIILPKLPISHLLITQKYRIRYQSNAKTEYCYLMGRYEKYLLGIVMNFNENIKNE